MASLTSALLAHNPDYIYPLVVNLIAGIVPVWASFKVAIARKRVGLKYPAEYFPGPIDEKTEQEKYLFNCTQRAHQNLMENVPSFLISFNIAAATFPKFASGVGLLWAIGRIIYQIGYGAKGPSGRRRGSNISGLTGVTLLFTSFYALFTEYKKYM